MEYLLPVICETKFPAWELCPKCLGEGGYIDGNEMPRRCKVCDGEMIINTLTGRPPGYQEMKEGPQIDISVLMK